MRKAPAEQRQRGQSVANSTVSQASCDTCNSDEHFKTELSKMIPFMRAFARSLTHNVESADDLAQETLAKAWQARSSFAPGTNLKAWLFMILRNQFYSDCRRAWRQVAWDQEMAEQIPDSPHQQLWSAQLSDTGRAFSQLSAEQREALILVAASGHSYDEAATICGCAVGTIKSRVARARKAIVAMLDGEQPLPPRSDAACRPPLAISDEVARVSAYVSSQAALQISP
jgi:RNA polymerase sigma-70 factor (ECF subfamily)